MHDELTTAEAAIVRLTHDTLVHVVRKPGTLRHVRVAVPASWDADAFAAGMRDQLDGKGIFDVEIAVLETAGDPRLLSVIMDR